MFEKLEDPAITRTINTGYPRDYHDPRLCECCGYMPIDQWYWEVGGMDVCSSCLIRIAVEELQEDIDKAAELVGAVRIDTP